MLLEGVGYSYTAVQGDTIDSAAQKLAATIAGSLPFDATASGPRVSITRRDATAFIGVAKQGATNVALSGTRSTTPSRPPSCGRPAARSPRATSGRSPSTRAASRFAEFNYVAGHNGESTTPAPMDVKVTDDDAPGVLVLQPTGSTNVTEPTTYIVLGNGYVTSVTTARSSRATSASRC